MRTLAALLLLTITALAQEREPAAAWNNWRGPEGTAVARDARPPLRWSETENVRWKVALPGLGSSSPVIWGERIYLTTAVETELQPDPSLADAPARFGRFGSLGPPSRVHEFAVLALDRSDGSPVWSRTVTSVVPHEGGHRTASQASNSPVTDGERIYAHFGSRGLWCLDLDGDVLWSVDFGRMETFREFGEGSSPALHGDTLVVNWDHEGDSFIAALDKRTGAELWRTTREEGTSWSTPVIATDGQREQVIVAATNASRAYDLRTGELLWSLTGMSTTAIPTPAVVDGVVYLMSGFRSFNLQAVRLAGARGDLEQSPNLLWSHQRNTSYVPSALVYDGFVYFVRNNSGVLSCLDAGTGAVHYEGQRLGMRTIYSSPVGAAGRVYLTGRDGTTKVIEVGPEYRELATNRLDDVFDATAAIAGDAIHLRGRSFLYCLADESRR